MPATLKDIRQRLLRPALNRVALNRTAAVIIPEPSLRFCLKHALEMSNMGFCAIIIPSPQSYVGPRGLQLVDYGFRLLDWGLCAYG